MAAWYVVSGAQVRVAPVGVAAAGGGPALGVLPRGAGGRGRGGVRPLPGHVPRRRPARGEGPHQPRAGRRARPRAAQAGARLRHLGEHIAC